MEKLIKQAYESYMLVNFNEIVGQDCPELPKFTVHPLTSGHIAVFAGRVSDTDYGRLVKALDVFNQVSGKPVELRSAA